MRFQVRIDSNVIDVDLHFPFWLRSKVGLCASEMHRLWQLESWLQQHLYFLGVLVSKHVLRIWENITVGGAIKVCQASILHELEVTPVLNARN